MCSNRHWLSLVSINCPLHSRADSTTIMHCHNNALLWLTPHSMPHISITHRTNTFLPPTPLGINGP